MIGLTAVAWSVCTLGADLAPRQSALSSSAQSGRKLKWLPYRPSVPSAARSAVVRQSSAPEASRASVRTAPLARTAPLVRTAQRPRGRAFEDPFGGTTGVRQSPRLAAAADQGVPDVGLPGSSLSGEFPFSETLPGKPSTQPVLEGPGPQYPRDVDPPYVDPPYVDPPYVDPLDVGPPDAIDECPSPTDPLFHTAIGDLSSDIAAEEGTFPRECLLTEETIEPFALGKFRHNSLGQPWGPTTFTWKASALCHKPLYFEEAHVERYGHSWGPLLQPLASGAHFFLTLPALPHKMGV